MEKKHQPDFERLKRNSERQKRQREMESKQEDKQARKEEGNLYFLAKTVDTRRSGRGRSTEDLATEGGAAGGLQGY